MIKETTSITLDELKKAASKFNAAWKKKGGKLAHYQCKHCMAVAETRQPGSVDVDQREYWDSLTTCTECGKYNFLKAYPDGTVTVT